MAGVEIKEDKFVYSHHAKDPAYLKLCNAFDIVRMHRFGDKDDKASYQAMCELAMQQDEVKVLASNERLAQASMDFSDADSDAWRKQLQYEPRSTVLKNNLHNITLILQNDQTYWRGCFHLQYSGRIFSNLGLLHLSGYSHQYLQDNGPRLLSAYHGQRLCGYRFLMGTNTFVKAGL